MRLSPKLAMFKESVSSQGTNPLVPGENIFITVNFLGYHTFLWPVYFLTGASQRGKFIPTCLILLFISAFSFKQSFKDLARVKTLSK